LDSPLLRRVPQSRFEIADFGGLFPLDQRRTTMAAYDMLVELALAETLDCITVEEIEVIEINLE
jgi:hypothetical protein